MQKINARLRRSAMQSTTGLKYIPCSAVCENRCHTSSVHTLWENVFILNGGQSLMNYVI